MCAARSVYGPCGHVQYNRNTSSPTQSADFFSAQAELARYNFTARKGPGDYIAWYSCKHNGSKHGIQLTNGQDLDSRRFTLSCLCYCVHPLLLLSLSLFVFLFALGQGAATVTALVTQRA
jgi:hypothetical protein